MSHAFQAPGQYIPAVGASQAAADTTGKAIPMWSDGINGFTFHNLWTGTVAFTLKFYASNDPRAAESHPDNASADWVEITSSVTHVDPTTGGGNNMVIVSNSRFAFFRMDTTALSGSGNFTSWVCSHGAG